MRALALLAAVAGCFNPKYTNGNLKCDNGKCPSGYHCAADDTCWKNGSDPELDLSVGGVDDGGFDLSMNGAMDGAMDVDMVPRDRHQGESCTPADTCDTGHCVDGYCCDSACNNTCQACNVTGQLGFCSNVPNGQSPAGSRVCNAQAASTCGRDGKCDGDGNCRDWPAGTECVAGTCTGATGDFTNPSTCNGSGTCTANGGGNCAPYKCQDTTQCWSSCTTGDNSRCSGANNCVSNSCGKLPDGRACGTNGAQCQSGKCVDGYCCDADCTDSCQACNVPGNLGACTTLTNNSMPVGTRTCTNLNTGTCGGKCNGSQSTCFYADTNVPCGVTCMSSQVKKSFCDHLGSCVAQAPATCSGNFACVGSACLATCSSNGDCYPMVSYGCNEGGVCKNYCVVDVDTVDNGCVVAQ